MLQVLSSVVVVLLWVVVVGCSGVRLCSVFGVLYLRLLTDPRLCWEFMHHVEITQAQSWCGAIAQTMRDNVGLERIWQWRLKQQKDGLPEK